MRGVSYYCSSHGQFVVDVRCGHGYGPAPKQASCPQCGRHSNKRYVRYCGRRAVSVTNDTYQRVVIHCAADGVSVSTFIDRITKDIP